MLSASTFTSAPPLLATKSASSGPLPVARKPASSDLATAGSRLDSSVSDLERARNSSAVTAASAQGAGKVVRAAAMALPSPARRKSRRVAENVMARASAAFVPVLLLCPEHFQPQTRRTEVPRDHLCFSAFIAFL